MLSYEHFMSVHSFLVPSREFINVTRAIPIELIQLIKSHLSYSNYKTSQPVLMLNGIELTDRKCNNKHIRQCYQRMNRVVPRGKFYWRSQIEDMNWSRAWLLPHKYCISNKAKEVHFKILHKIYPVNGIIAKFVDVDVSCTFCNHITETTSHLFFIL